MNALARLAQNFMRRMSTEDKPRPEPECLYPPRPMTGFFTTLTDNQKKAALAHRGDDSYGDPAFPKRLKKA